MKMTVTTTATAVPNVIENLIRSGLWNSISTVEFTAPRVIVVMIVHGSFPVSQP